MEKILQKAIQSALQSSVPTEDIKIEFPADMLLGDFSTNIALVLAKKENKNPHDLANEIVDSLKSQNIEYVEKIEVAGPGFINFFMNAEYFYNLLKRVIDESENYGKNEINKSKKIIVEFTDPNPFKEFHIGHLMSNTIGESLSRLFEYSGADVKRATYQGDVGMQIAKAIWGIQKSAVRDDTPTFLGVAYALGTRSYESDDKAKREIEDINRKIYDKSDKNINEIYEWGRNISLKSFEVLYERLGSKFDYNFFESEAAPVGLMIVKKWAKSGLFEESEGAYVFRGEQFGLHTRVFVNSQGLPTYEAKELALPDMKYEKYKYTDSFVITGNEVNDYFKVLLTVLSKINPDLASKTNHIGHGMLRMPEGKMSSRTGNIVTTEGLLDEIKVRVLDKMENKDETIADQIAVGAIKYSILKQGIGKNIIFEFDKALSFEGDSGPYIQYSAVRAKSILQKSNMDISIDSPEEIGLLEKYISRFPTVVEYAIEERAPQIITNFITVLASEFNSYYAQNQIGDNSYRLALTKAVFTVLKNGLHILGIKIPERM
ncbi:arginine--tRNA ligase [Candidatus Campbellbacteria bacterium CG22_combo_CG10-13_8_21_14_all_36_13]|uniref:Arginine--tRNA ligase n=1 Tax=Candidatus Campbellbacteria bacterium CG22_combo_CG10-13_8_21_14_all_36_13 TaxID=1974529 RepID=A0A2H0DZ75_9BACT|nr:MAG: arginine--tRNA ligase [Candidatus Campbellbacteria bacterium CG22_combo_CG10-13_8_21_14_all_36_13]